MCRWVSLHADKELDLVYAALAGVRVGYGAFPKELISYLWRAKQPYNVSVAAEVTACAALSNLDYMQARMRSIYPTNKSLL